jgi:hypothetical protein
MSTVTFIKENRGIFRITVRVITFAKILKQVCQLVGGSNVVCIGFCHAHGYGFCHCDTLLNSITQTHGLNVESAHWMFVCSLILFFASAEKYPGDGNDKYKVSDNDECQRPAKTVHQKSPGAT